MTVDPARDALLVVDVQGDFLPGGALAVPHGDAVVEPIRRLLPRFGTVVATQDFHPPGHVSFASASGAAPYAAGRTADGREQTFWPDHCVAGTPGAALGPGLAADLDRFATLVLRKGTRQDTDSYSAFRENLDPAGRRPSTGLGAWLGARGVRRVVVAGLALDFCVGWTARDAVAEGFQAGVYLPGARAVFPEHDARTLAELEAAGVAILRAPL
ncbi:nicotinamidase [Anaeromyxobacter paludicola]|uniref:nicotinamidase n=1 Tax=Anaeromyxobacter paludicola TaxID=2918171 RepID=A0ABN6N1B3_9BACT|nr:nicotinamidase [Anaeromyxobacter paludicola]BDG07010.1 bifunctional pyrazinamidase/nicotinamidase [Anaeromyxobacter paludicola]